MKKPRYSIIPAGAVTDRRLEGRDLQVLCLIGCYTDKLGWWSGRQTELAQLLDCGRATVQRSLARLADAQWLEIRRESVTYKGRPYASYAYRVLMDRDDPDCGPSGLEAKAQTEDDDAHGWASSTMPTGGHGAQGAQSESKNGQGVPTHTRAQDSRPSIDLDSGGDARANDCDVSPEATELANQIAVIAGLPDADARPKDWQLAAARIDVFLRQGFAAHVLLAAARSVMANYKYPHPPRSIGYFEQAFARERSRVEAPLPKPDVSRGTNGARHVRRSETADVIDALDQFARSQPDDPPAGGGAGQPSIERIPLPKLG